MSIYLDGRVVVSGDAAGFLNIQNPKDLAILIYQAINQNDTYAQLVADYLVALSGAASLPDHASRHETGGADEIDVTDLVGLLADRQNPLFGYGETVSRPGSPENGEMYFDTDLGLPIWYHNAAWVDATGLAV